MNLPAPVERAWEWASERGENLSRRVAAVVQPVVVKVLLVVVYTLGMSLTWLVARVFYRKMLAVDDAVEKGGSFWREADGYGLDPERLHRQF